MEPDGTLLVARLAVGDDRALAEVFDAYGTAVLTAARHVLGDLSRAQDVVQETFVELWRRPQRYDPKLGSVRTYLVVLARRRAYDLLRAELRRTGREQRHQRLTPGGTGPSPEEVVAAADAADVVRAAVRELPAAQREVVELAYFGGLSYRDVAVALGIPEGTAKSRLRLALGRLEDLLDRELLEAT